MFVLTIILISLMLASCRTVIEPTMPKPIPAKGPAALVENCTYYPSHYVLDYRNLGQDHYEIFNIATGELEGANEWHHYAEDMLRACQMEEERVNRSRHLKGMIFWLMAESSTKQSG